VILTEQQFNDMVGTANEAIIAAQESLRLNRDLLERLRKVKDWRERHAEHAGHAPLSELDPILEGLFSDATTR
jgi:hypothetical protein